MPNLSKNAPTQPLVTQRWVREIPATAVGRAKGSSMMPSKNRLPGNSYRTSIQAKIKPMTALITAAIRAVEMLTQ